MGRAGRHRAVRFIRAGGPIIVVGAFGVFAVHNSVGMHAVRMRGIVLENDFQSVADFATQHGTDDAEILFVGSARLYGGKRGVGIFAVDRFFVDAAQAVRAGFGVQLFDLVEGMAHGLVAAGRRVIPDYFVGGDEVGAGLADGWDIFLRGSLGVTAAYEEEEAGECKDAAKAQTNARANSNFHFSSGRCKHSARSIQQPPIFGRYSRARGEL